MNEPPTSPFVLRPHGSSSPATTPTRPPITHGPAHTRHDLVLRDRDPDSDALPADAASTTGIEDTFDALAEMFLGPASVDEDRCAASHDQQMERDWGAATTPRVELLLLGHLPVRARPWASQYAAALAHDSRQPVALLRVAGGQVSVDVFGDDEASSAASIEDALRAVGERAAVCLIEVEGPQGELLASDPRVDALTLLVGGGDAAIVDAYRTIKSLTGGVHGSGGDLEPRSVPRIRLGLMGLDDEQALAASDKLREAASVFLGRDLEPAVSVQRMSPTGARTIVDARSPLTGAELLEELVGMKPGGQPIAFPADSPAATEPEPPARVLEPDDHGEDAAEVEVEPDADIAVSRDVEPRLCALVAGLTPLDVACVPEPFVELGVDDRGVLHVVGHAGENGLERVLAARAWARDHAVLIEQASGVSIDAETVVRAVVFAQDAEEAARLRGLGVGVHRMVAVPEGARWVGVPV
jgi:hypothetical protein